MLDPVSFPDGALDAAVRAALPTSVPAGQPIDGALIAALDSLDALGAGISRLDGLESARPRCKASRSRELAGRVEFFQSSCPGL